jgi:hypothetical protein
MHRMSLPGECPGGCITSNTLAAEIDHIAFLH